MPNVCAVDWTENSRKYWRELFICLFLCWGSRWRCQTSITWIPRDESCSHGFPSSKLQAEISVRQAPIWSKNTGNRSSNGMCEQHPSTHTGPDKQAMMSSGPRTTVQTTAVQGQSTKHGNIYLIYVHFPGNMKTVRKLEESKWINLNFCILSHSIWLSSTRFISLSFSENPTWVIWGLLLVVSKGRGRHS